MTEITNFDLAEYSDKQEEPDTGDWTLKAACQGVDTRVFYPQNQQGYLDPQQYIKKTAQWRQYCLECPVARQCEAYAIESESEGVFGGKLFVRRLNGTWKVHSFTEPLSKPGPKGSMKVFPCNCTGMSGEVHLLQGPSDLVGKNKCRRCAAVASRKYREKKRDRLRSEARVS